MKQITKTFVLAFAICFLALPVVAAAAESPTIAVVDMQQLMNESKAGKNIQEQLEARKKAFLSELSAQEQKLREDEKMLSEQRASLSQEEFAKKAKAFEEKLAQTRSKAQGDKRALEEQAAKALGKLRAEIHTIVQRISDEKGYGLIVSRQAVVISSKELDITSEALESLNKNISEITL